MRIRVISIAASLFLLGVGSDVPGVAETLRTSDSSVSPNVVLIVIDTLRADHLPFHGYEKNTAPFLSELAAQGAVFERAASVSSWTAPGTASIVTSLYPFQHGVVLGFKASRTVQEAHPSIKLNRIPEEVETIAEVFRASGYRTFAITDNLNICAAEGFDQGFDRFKNFTNTPYASAEAVNAELERWRGDISGDGPYFLYLHYNDPHTPYRRRGPWFEDRGDTELNVIESYDSEISYVDDKIADAAERFGWRENTVVLVTSDHGEEFAEHGQIQHGKTLYAEVIHVPLVIYAPGRIPPGRRIRTHVGTVDVLPTLRELAGVAARGHEEGISLVPLATGASGDGAGRPLFGHLKRVKAEYALQDMLKMYVIHNGWKYIFTLPDEEELFHLDDDPGDVANRIDAEPATARALQELLMAFRRDCVTYRQETVETSVDLERLRSLGYIE